MLTNPHYQRLAYTLKVKFKNTYVINIFLLSLYERIPNYYCIIAIQMCISKTSKPTC